MDDPSQSLCDEQHPCSNYSGTFSCTTFNILAPIYKRLTAEVRESKDYDLWLRRNENILNRLMELKSSIICLQEFWIENEELVKLYERRLGQAGYVTYKCARTNNRGDGSKLPSAEFRINVTGLLAAVRQDHIRVLHYKECLYNDIGDRVAQLLHVELLVHPRNQSSLDIRTEALVMNTHLIFPHDSRYCFVRLQQVYKMLQFIESYCHEYKLAPLPIILCGDWNGSKKGNVCKFLKSQGFISSYDSIHDPTHTGEECFEWVSHHNHRGNLCAVDFIWLLNPNICRKPLKWSYIEALLGNVNKLRCNVPNKGVASLPSLKFGGSSITYPQFSRVLAEIDQLGIKGHRQINLTDEDMSEFWEHNGIDEDGTIDLSLCAEECKSEISEQTEVTRDTITSEILCGFDVSKATLFPPEVERGIWPEKYSLSDHACLTVEFSVVQL